MYMCVYVYICMHHLFSWHLRRSEVVECPGHLVTSTSAFLSPGLPTSCFSWTSARSIGAAGSARGAPPTRARATCGPWISSCRAHDCSCRTQSLNHVSRGTFIWSCWIFSVCTFVPQRKKKDWVLSNPFLNSCRLIISCVSRVTLTPAFLFLELRSDSSEGVGVILSLDPIAIAVVNGTQLPIGGLLTQLSFRNFIFSHP